ncbi:MAG TPA: hypothetical protein VIY51_14195 [Xanthobacteraceae bacterium]
MGTMRQPIVVQPIVMLCAFFLFVASFSAIYISFRTSTPQIKGLVGGGFFLLAALLLLWKDLVPFTMTKKADLSTFGDATSALVAASGHPRPDSD